MKKKIKAIISIHLWIIVAIPIVMCSLIEKVFLGDVTDDDIKCAPKSLQTFAEKLSDILSHWIY